MIFNFLFMFETNTHTYFIYYFKHPSHYFFIKKDKQNYYICIFSFGLLIMQKRANIILSFFIPNKKMCTWFAWKEKINE